MSTYNDDLIGLAVVSDTVKQCISPPQSYSDQFEQECFRFLSAISRERKKLERLARVEAIRTDTGATEAAPELPLVDKSSHKKKAD